MMPSAGVHSSESMDARYGVTNALVDKVVKHVEHTGLGSIRTCTGLREEWRLAWDILQTKRTILYTSFVREEFRIY